MLRKKGHDLFKRLGLVECFHACHKGSIAELERSIQYEMRAEINR